MQIDDIKLEAHCAPCYNFLKDNVEEKKTVWMVPLVIKRTGGTTRIIWRCNWGRSCEAGGCIYARAKEEED